MMKNLFGLKKMFMASLALAMVFSVASCKQDDDDDSSSNSSGGSSVTLPASVGDNVLKGKTWERTYSEGSSSSSESVAFSDSTVTRTRTYSGEESGSESKVYNYSYDATKNLVYMSFKSVFGTEGGESYSYSSLSEFEAELNKFAAEEGMSAEEKAAEIASFKAELERTTVYKYTIAGSYLNLVAYFGGTLPSNVEFMHDVSGYSIELRDDRLYLEEWNENGRVRVDGKARGVTFSNGTFSGKLYDRHDEETEIGDVAGTYTISGEGSSATVTVKFISLPSVYKKITANTDYVLEQDKYNSGTTYTLKQ